jgi:predicted secreted hydrolase
MSMRRPPSARLGGLQAVVLLLGGLLSGCGPSSTTPSGDADGALGERLGGDDTAGYARVFDPREFRFPADHGPHPDYRNEWWYLTGNLAAADGRRFGYQVTFFRIALAPEDPQAPPRRSNWGGRQIWMTHVALSDAANRRHREHERFARGAAGLAGAQSEPFRVWLEDWQLSAAPDDPAVWSLQVETEDFGLEFRLEPRKPIVLQGVDGLSQKSDEPGNASYYYSLPRLQTSGEIRLDSERHRVEGLSWLDREWSTSALGDDQVGWDWFALQFDDGRDLMYYLLRRTDGSVDPHSAGTLIDRDGRTTRLAAGDVRLEALRWWRSADGVRYPVAWRMDLYDGSAYRVEAVFDDQRMDTTVSYWEGMVQVFATESGAPLGRGYMELAGYESP